MNTDTPNKSPRGIVIAGLSGGSGKSAAAVGLLAALKRRGLNARPFKKGPDYIDAGWLAKASGQPCYNLDAWLAGPEATRDCFFGHLSGMDCALVEGNRGLFDGVDAKGAFSTAELAILLDVPVILVINCAKLTRTAAALALGCRIFEPRLALAGLILNRVATARQERVIREALALLEAEHPAGARLPVLGIIPRMKRDIFPMRHLGVTPPQEHEDADRVPEQLADMAETRFDIPAILNAMRPVAVPPPAPSPTPPERPAAAPRHPLKIGVLRDAAFQFYYEENLEALQARGAELVMLNAFTTPSLPEDLRGLYIGGGFPETSAGRLAENAGFRASVRAAIEQGLPVYAECGGLIYLGESIRLEDGEYPLTGVLPVSFGLSSRPQAHGYSVLRVEGDNPFYEPGTEIRGHEFRYSTVARWEGRPEALVMRVERGTGFQAGRDGLVYKNTLALYTHVLASGAPAWADGLIRAARRFAEASS